MATLNYMKLKRVRPVGYNRFHMAKHRCENKDCKDYHNYGGRGIKFKFKDYKEMLAALGPCPGPEYTMDRINSNGHYEAGNVRWADKKEQARNRRVGRLCVADVLRIRGLLNTGLLLREIAMMYGVSKTLIHFIRKGKYWQLSEDK